MFERKVCSECGKEKDIWEFYDKYARCKQCTREDQNAVNWYKPVATLPYEEWPGALQAYVEVRREYLSHGRSVPAIAKEMVLAYNLSQGVDPDEPTEVTLPVVIALHRQVRALTERVDKLAVLVDAPRSAQETRVRVGELTNLYRRACEEVDALVASDTVDPMDAADVKEGIRLINQAIASDMSVPAKGVLNCVLTLKQLSLSAPASLEELYLKYYKPYLATTEAPDRARVQDIAGVDLYEYDWLQFLQEE